MNGMSPPARCVCSNPPLSFRSKPPAPVGSGPRSSGVGFEPLGRRDFPPQLFACPTQGELFLAMRFSAIARWSSSKIPSTAESTASRWLAQSGSPRSGRRPQRFQARASSRARNESCTSFHLENTSRKKQRINCKLRTAQTHRKQNQQRITESLQDQHSAQFPQSYRKRPAETL